MLVLLDIDGTLVDTNYLHVDAWSRALHDLGVKVPRAAIHRQIGKGSDQFLPVFLKDEARRKKADALHAKFVDALKDNAFPLPGAVELLDALCEAGHSLWLATSGTQDEVDARLKSLGIDKKRFDGIVNSGDVEHSKPKPDIFLKALERAKAKPETAIVIGDTRWDMEAARAAGIRAIGLPSGGAYSTAELKATGAEAVYEDCADVVANGLTFFHRGWVSELH